MLYEQKGAACIGLSVEELCEMRLAGASVGTPTAQQQSGQKQPSVAAADPVTGAPTEAGAASAAPLQQGSVMQRMMEAQAVAAAAQAAAAAKQDQMLKEMAEMMEKQEALKEQQDREMALLAQEFTALGSRTDFAADAPPKKSSACAIQ